MFYLSSTSATNLETKVAKAEPTETTKINAKKSSSASNKVASVYDLSLEELIKLKPVQVTARKRTELVRDVPGSVSVIGQALLETYTSAARDNRALSARSPSLQIESSFDRLFPRIYLRGLGNTDFDINASQPVSVVFDGVVQENPMLRGFPLFDMQRVEVLRGPQGTLFGRNTPAGVIKFESVRPQKLDVTSASLSYGNHQTVDFNGIVNTQLTNQLTGRVSLLMQHRENWIDNAAPNFEQQNALGGLQENAIRAQFGFDNGEQLNWLLSMHYRDFEATPAVFRANILSPGSNRLNQNFVADQVFLDAASRTEQNLANWGGNFTLNYQFKNLLLTSITGYESLEAFSVGDVDGGYGAVFTSSSGPGHISFPAENASDIPKHEQYTQEIRWSSKDQRTFGYQFGVFAFKENLFVRNLSFDSLNNGELTGLSVQRQTTNAWAIFGNVDVDITDQFRMTTGIRFGNDQKQYSTERFLSPIGAGTLDPVRVEQGDSHISWDISGIYQWSDSSNLFYRLAKGFRAPSIQGRVIFGDAVTTASSEQVISFETGIKTTFWNEQASINATLFTYNIKDQQVTAVGGEDINNRLLNVDNTESFGFELDAELVFDRNWRVYTGLSFNESEIQDSQLSVSTCARCTVSNPINDNGFAILDGNHLPHSPHWIAFLHANYESEFKNGLLFFQTDWSYRSEVNFFLYESEEFTGPPLLEGGMKLGYRWSKNNLNYQVSLLTRNITNQQQVIGGVDFNNLTGIVNQPRYVGIELKIGL
jgi:iron complex outermembrane recepter protein